MSIFLNNEELFEVTDRKKFTAQRRVLDDLGYPLKLSDGIRQTLLGIPLHQRIKPNTMILYLELMIDLITIVIILLIM